MTAIMMIVITKDLMIVGIRYEELLLVFSFHIKMQNRSGIWKLDAHPFTGLYIVL